MTRDGEYIRMLCERHFVCNGEHVVEEYIEYKRKHIDKLQFVNEQMLKVYEYAFFFHFNRIRTRERRMWREVDRKMFARALAEVEKSCVFPTTEEKKEKAHIEESVFVCNLYSIVNR